MEKGEKEISSKILDLKNKLSSAEAAARNLKSELEKTANTKVKTKAAEGLERDLAKAKQKLSDFYVQADRIGDAKQAELKGLGFGDDYLDKALAQDKAWRQIQEKIAQAEAQVQRYEKALARANEAAPLAKDTADYQKKQQRLDELSGQVEVYRTKLREAVLSEAEQSAATARSAGEISAAKRHLERTISALKLFAKGAARAGSTLKAAFSKTAGKLIQNIGSYFRRANSSTNILEKSLRRIKNTLVRMFFFRIVHSPLDAVKDGLGEIAKVSPGVNKNLSALKTESAYLKNTLASLAAPLVGFVTPAFTAFMQTLSVVTEKAAQLVAMLTGQTYTKAVKAQQDYAASLDNSTAAADQNTKALEKNQNALAGFDELNVLNSGDSDDSSGSQAVSPFFENADAQAQGLAQTLLDSIRRQDFNAVGAMLGDKINEGLGKIKWNKIQDTLKRWAVNIADFFNGFIRKTDWKLVGASIGKGVNTALGFVKTFIMRFDWKQAGAALHDALVSLFGAVSWQDVSDIVTEGINGLVDFAVELIGETDFFAVGSAIGEQIQEAVRNINWKGIGELMTKLFTGAVNLVDGLVLSVKWENFGKSLAESFNSFFGAGGGGLDFIKRIGKTLGDITVSVSDFIIGFFSDPKSADTFAHAIESFFKSIPWLEIIIKSITGGIEIGTWIIQGVTKLVENFCKALADGFSNSKDDPELKSAITGLGKALANLFIGVLNSLIGIIVTAVPNIFIGLIKSILTAFSWLLQFVLGEDFYNQSMQSLDNWKGYEPKDAPKIPYLATGTVIPANYGEFLAVLGDNKREAEIVSPVSAMKQAFLEALAEGNFSGGDGEQEINLYLDGDKLFSWLIDKNSRYRKAHGYPAFGGAD